MDRADVTHVQQRMLQETRVNRFQHSLDTCGEIIPGWISRQLR